jgi:hypothetical protein
MPDTTNVSNLYEVGNKKFFAAELNANGTFGAKSYHESLMEVKIEFSQEVTEIGADDIPGYITLAGPVTGEGTVKFAVLPYAIYSKFFNVTEDRNGAFVVNGKAVKPKQVAFGYYSTLGDGTESMFTLYKAVFSLPSLTTVSFDGKTIRDLTLNVKIYPYEYTDATQKKQQVSYTILNSGINSDVWAEVQDSIYIPDTEVG